MNVCIEIEHAGQKRKAVPVRAIPFLANWRFISPDQAAHLFAQDDGCNLATFHNLKSWMLEAGIVKAFPRVTWAEWIVRELKALSDEIEAVQPSHEAGYARWRRESIEKLPAAVFVWADELIALHKAVWGERHRSLSFAIPIANGEVIDEDSPRNDADRSPGTPQFERWLRRCLEDLEGWRELDFHPFVPTGMAGVLMEGFPWVAQAVAQRGAYPEIDDLYRHLERVERDLRLWDEVGAPTAIDLDLKLTRTSALRAEQSEIRGRLIQIRDESHQETAMDTNAQAAAEDRTERNESRQELRPFNFAEPRVFWRYLLAKNIRIVDHDKKAPVRVAVAWLIANSGGRIREPDVKKYPDSVLEWRDDMGNWQQVKKPTVSNALADLRRSTLAQSC